MGGFIMASMRPSDSTLVQQQVYPSLNVRLWTQSLAPACLSTRVVGPSSVSWKVAQPRYSKS